MKRLLLPLGLGLTASLLVLPPLERTARIGVAAAIAAVAGGGLLLAIRRAVADEATPEPAGAVRLVAPWPARIARPTAQRLLRVARRSRTAETELSTLEHAVASALRDGLSAHLFLLPQLRTLAADRLRVERGVDLWRQPQAAQAVLGDGAWALLSPRRASLADVGREGLEVSALAAALDALERLDEAPGP